MGILNQVLTVEVSDSLFKIIYCFFILLFSVFFSKAVIGMLVGFLAWFLNFFPYFFLANRYDELGKYATFQ